MTCVGTWRLRPVSTLVWKRYIRAVEQYVHEVERKASFHKFHVAQHLGDAVDKVRLIEHKEVQRGSDTRLKRTWVARLRNPEAMTRGQSMFLDCVNQVALAMARAWAIKGHATCFWQHVRRGWPGQGGRRGWSYRGSSP